MALLQQWREYAYGVDINSKAGQGIWAKYFREETAVYEQLLADPETVVTGTVKELAEKYDTEVMIMTGFLDGINESLKGYENPIETMDEDTKVKIEIDPEKLYYNMVEAIFLFLAKVVTVIICAGFLVLPLYLIATLFYAIYKDCRCLNKAKSTRDKISA